MAEPFSTLRGLGQSLWYDNIQRHMLESGELEELIRRGELRGMTSNPSIFNQAIAKSTDYDAALKAMAWSGYTSEQILDHLMIEDIRDATDLFLPLYQESGGRDGFVSIEVSPDRAYDTRATLEECRRLWDAVAHPNLMVKIPATQEGLSAIRQAIAEGINVNITLIFSRARYIQVMDAYLSGLEARLEAGLPIEQIASVASFFVSRIDSKIDKRLEKIVKDEESDARQAARLLGKAAVANARLAYAEFLSTFSGPRWERLEENGAKVQRPLWASTSTKNPAYSPIKYVEELIGVDTVNTVPQSTLEAIRASLENFPSHTTVEKNLDEAQQVFEELSELGIFIDEVTHQLEEEGVKAFTDAAQMLLQTIETRRQDAVAELGPLVDVIPNKVLALQEMEAVGRIWTIDPSIWTEDLDGQREIRKRLGWLALPGKSKEMLPELRFFAEEIRQAGFTHTLLLGMGGSSLAPEVMSLVFSGEEIEGLKLSILDSTDPAQVLEASRRSSVERTLYIVASKSGGTAEVNAFLDYYWDLAQKTVGNHAAGQFIAITDPDSPLESLARERGFRRIFLSDPKVGGRYSALTAFGLVPAALMGIDVGRLLKDAALMSRQMTVDVPPGRNPGLVLGAVIAEAARSGRDKLTLVADDGLESFGSWLEQLIAESSGKQGKGIVPVDLEPLAEPQLYGQDRLFVYLRQRGTHDEELSRLRKAGHPAISIEMGDAYDLGGAFYLWEFATAVAGVVMGFNPFDQPDVQDSKTRTAAKIANYQEKGELDEGHPDWQVDGVAIFGSEQIKGDSLKEILTHFLEQGKPGDYVGLNAYLPNNERNQNILGNMRVAVRERTHLATTVGFGPRFLHSTGQLHKGGPNIGLFIQITAHTPEDVAIPGRGMSFAILERAQALGDYEALLSRGRRVLRIHLQEPGGLEKLLAVLQTM